MLVLDEPTNHLDLWACDALEQALLDFEGTVIVVSHDRYFLNRVVDLLLVLEGDGTVQVIYGNYDTYELMRLLQEPAKAAKRRTEAQSDPRTTPGRTQAGEAQTASSRIARWRSSKPTSPRRKRG